MRRVSLGTRASKFIFDIMRVICDRTYKLHTIKSSRRKEKSNQRISRLCWRNSYQEVSIYVICEHLADLTAAFDKSAIFERNLKDDLTAQWKPPGELLKTISKDGKTFEIWKGSLADKAVQQILKRIQILVSFFIEGGTFIDLEDPEWSLERWTVFFMYSKDLSPPEGVSPYTFVGYSTVYRYYLFRLPTPPASPTKSSTADFELPLDLSISDTPSRSRISQFIILPTAQAIGAGSTLYDTIFTHYQPISSVVEITVEDPNEAFDDLRDYNDLTRLRSVPAFTKLRLNHSATIRTKGPVPNADLLSVSLPELDSLRLEQKIAPRQFGRLVEMQLLSLIPTSIRQSLLPSTEKLDPEATKKAKREYYLWGLLAKQRLYRHNKQALMQLDRAERIEKLEEALSGVEADYGRLLRRLEARTNGKAEENGKSAGKRGADDLEDAESSGEGASKRARVEDA